MTNSSKNQTDKTISVNRNPLSEDSVIDKAKSEIALRAYDSLFPGKNEDKTMIAQVSQVTNPEIIVLMCGNVADDVREFLELKRAYDKSRDDFLRLRISHNRKGRVEAGEVAKYGIGALQQQEDQSKMKKFMSIFSRGGI